jgi:negative regulator of flagellin synthesis FlgM
MKIGPHDNKAVGAPANERKTTPAATPATGGAAAEPSAKVELSSTASALSVGGDGDFDSEKVERIAQAIRDGKFQVNHEAIADKLIANAQELLGPATPK